MGESFTCPRCGRTSHNPIDAAEGYCGACRAWTRDEGRPSELTDAQAERRETPSYRPTPPMPETQQEWEAHWAFYRLTVEQRDAAWREVEQLTERLERIRAYRRQVEGAG